MKKLFHKLLWIIVPAMLFIGTYFVYKNIYPEPRNWYDHYLHLAKSIMVGRVDVPNLPSFYHDKIDFQGRIYLPFPPMPAIILIPFLIIFKNISQQSVSIFFGAVDVALIYMLLKKFTKQLNATLLAIFFGFGTSFFWSAEVGTTWFFSHIVGIFFLALSLISHFSQKDYLAGIFLAMAGLSRFPLILTGFFYLLTLFKEKPRLLKTIIGAFIFVPIFIFYNYARFGTLFEIGYPQVYQQYATSSYPFTILQKIDSAIPYFNYFDIRSIPLHLFTMFLFPPTLNISDGVIKTIQPSPFGMGILFTSPLLLLAFKPKFKTALEKNLIIAALFISIPSLLHFMQGWVQFGYRFMLDYLIFLMIILALRFRVNTINLLLIIISLIVNFWGVSWAIKLGW